MAAMESTTVSGLRSRSRSKTPFLRSSRERENPEGEDNAHTRSGRKTPVKRSTPTKQLQVESSRLASETLTEVAEEVSSPPAHRTRKSTTKMTEKLVKTSDYSSEESLDRLRGNSRGNSRKEIIQNEINTQYERVSTTRRSALPEISLSPIQSQSSFNLTDDRSTRFGSPAYSGCSTDSSFAEQALADASVLLENERVTEHLPYRLYKMAGEYWNKYPKTDYTYSHLSRDRVELAPGQIAVPNMSRRSLSQFRRQGPITSSDEVDRLAAWTTTTTRKRFTSVESSDDEDAYDRHYRGLEDRRWWITRLLISIITSITTTTSSAFRAVVGTSHRYPYTDRKPQQASLASRAATAAAAPFYWTYTIIKKVYTTVITTVTETITSNHVGESEKYLSENYSKSEPVKRRWWPWILLLLLPAIAYGCYKYESEPPALADTFKPPEVTTDSDLSKRVSALESWAVNVDSKLKLFNQKLTKYDNLEAQIEQYSLKHMQNNLVQIFNMAENSDAIAAKLKNYFDKHYMTRDQVQVLSQEVHERLISSWKPDMDEDRIRRIIQEYLAIFERRQLEILVEKVREYVKEVQIHHTSGDFDAEAVKRIVAGMLDVYDADKTGMVDYALESAGGQVISTKCTELYQIKTKQYSVLGLPVWWVYTSPRFALTPGAMPAECWAFQGFPGYLVVRTYAIIEVTGFSLEHMSRLLAADGKIESAPKNFSVYGLHGEMDPEPHLFGNYMYDANGTAIQYFPVKYPKTTSIDGVLYPVAYDIMELRVESNHGNPTYTCVYRFRVHGNPLNDIKKATEDSIKDSES